MAVTSAGVNTKRRSENGGHEAGSLDDCGGGVGGGRKMWDCGLTVEVSDPSDPNNVIVEKAVRGKSLKKPTGELTKADLEKVTALGLGYTKITDAGLKEVTKLQNLDPP